MPNVAAGTVWNLPNYTGELFTADMINTPLLSMIGGLGGGSMSDNFEFPTASQFSHEALVQESITEADSLTAPTAVSYVRTQEKNVVQIFQRSVNISYVKMSNQGRLQGINTTGAANNVISEKDWQIARTIEGVARSVEWHLFNGTYAISVSDATPNQTRGMLELATTVNTVAAGNVLLTKALIDQLLLEMFTNGALFKNLVIYCNGFQRQILSDVYGYAPEDRVVGGLSIQQIITDFGNISVAPAHRMMPTTSMLFAEMSALDLVFQPVPGKGNFFYEELAKVGASEKGQMYGQIGLAHGPAFLHGTLTGLKDS